MKTFTKLTSAALLSASFVMPAMAADKIGVVDYQKVFQNVPQGKSTVEKMQKQLEPEVANLKKEQKTLSDKIQKLERDGPTMSKSKRQAAQKKLQSEQSQFQDKVQSLHKTQMQKEHKAASKFQDALQASVDKVAKADNYDLVLNSQAAPYYKSDYNVTSEVISSMTKS